MNHFFWRRIRRISGFALLLSLGVGCRTTPQNPDQVDLDITVAPQGSGEFAIAGQTTLPDDTDLMAAAIRYLEPERPIVSQSPPTYTILDYQPITVQNGQLSATLNLWRVDTDGVYQEAWQPFAEQLELDVSPQDSVQFVVTLAPRHLLTPLYQALQKEGLQLGTPLIRITPEGETYLVAEDSLQVALPSGQTSPPPEFANRVNGGWGERYLLVPEPPLPYTLQPFDERKTNAPITPEESLY